MENQKYAKIIKIVLWVLMILSVGVLVWGSIKGFPATVAQDNGTVDPLLYWTYIVLGIALAAVILVGLYVTATTNPKGLIKIGIAVVAAAVLFGICYLLASGAPAIGYSGATPPTATELKMTDTILNLAYLVGGATILSIIFAEVFIAIRNKK
jgi:TRAP-type C4-dicarboxylate transport system permease small subunit